jgi:transposase
LIIKGIIVKIRVDNHFWFGIIILTNNQGAIAMSNSSQVDPKLEALREQGTVNNRSDRVSDQLFQEEEFFDPRDLVQVKYEMLRRVQKEGTTVTDAADVFGVSRVAFYETQKRFQSRGLAGLLPGRRGPKQAHKLTPEVVKFLEEALAEEPLLRPSSLVQKIKQHFGVSVHPRSIERALIRHEKKHQP